MRTHESPALFLVPVDVGSDGALGPHQAEDWGLDPESMQLGGALLWCPSVLPKTNNPNARMASKEPTTHEKLRWYTVN